MSSVHKIMIIGYLGADPETRQTPGGQTVTNCSVATTEKWTDKSTGEVKERTTWFRVAFWARLAEVAGEYLRKGSLVYVEGTVAANPYTTRDGKAGASLEVTARELKMLGKGEGQQPSAGTQRPAAAAAGAGTRVAGQPAAAAREPTAMERAASTTDADFDDDIPF